MPQLTPEAQKQLQDLLATPAGFAEIVLEMKLYDWQIQCLAWYCNPFVQTLGAICTPNGAGKSSGIVAALALWWIWLYPKGKVVITTKDSKQLEEQLYPALERHRGRFDWKWVTSPYIQIETKTGAKIVAFTTNDPGRAEGWHKLDDEKGPLLMIVDEAKSVEPQIFEAIDRCTYNALLYVSSPGDMEGQFYEAFSRNKGLFQTRQVSLLECPHIPKEKIERFKLKYGVDSPLYRSSILGQFMELGDHPYVFPRAAVRSALQDPPKFSPGPATYFCDFAAGGDENVLAKREGNRVSIVHSWREKDTMSAVMRFIMHFRAEKAEASRIFADNGGMGKSMIDALWKAGWEVNRVDNQTHPMDSNYINRGAEMWHETAAALRRSELVFENGCEQDDTLIEQLCTRRAVWNNQGRLGVERKEDMKKRGVNSPDRADAICGAWACHGLIIEQRKSIFEEYEELEEQAALSLPGGMDAGN